MNRFVALGSTVVLIGGLFSTRAQTTNTVTVGQPVPDANLTGMTSSQTLSFAPGTTISDIKVTLNISGGYNGDLFGYIYHNGQYAVLLNRTGRTAGSPAGQAGAGMTITLSDGAPDIHSASGSDPLTGTWAPDGRTTFPSMTLDTDSRSSTPLGSAFDGTDPNGTWTLFLADVDFGSTSTLDSWGLIMQINAVPEPSILALMALAGLTVGGAKFLRRRQKV